MWWNCHSTCNFLLGDWWSIHRQWWFRCQVCKITYEASEASSLCGGNLEALNLLDMVAKEEATVVPIHVQEQMINQKQIHCRWISKSKHPNTLTRQWYVLLWESSFHTLCIEIVHGMPNQQSMHSEKRAIPFAFDRSLLWGSMNYSLTQSGEQKTSSGADGPHAQIRICICGKRRGNIISLLVLYTYIGDTSISWSYLTFHVAERCSAAIVTSYLQTFWCDDLGPCKKDQKKRSTCTSTDMLWHLNLTSSQIQSIGHHLCSLQRGNNGPHSTKMKVFTLIGLTCLLIFRSILSYATIYMRKQKRLPLQKLQTRPDIQANDPASEGAANVLKNSHTLESWRCQHIY